MKLQKYENVEHLRRTVEYLYDLLDDISTADDTAKDNDAFYRLMVRRIQNQKNATGVQSLDGYSLDIEEVHFRTKREFKQIHETKH